MQEAEKLKTYDPAKFRPGFASVKRNGIHATYDSDLGIFYSRTPREIKGLEVLTSYLKDIKLHISGVNIKYQLMGELIIPGLAFEEASGLIRSHHSTPEALFFIFNSKILDFDFETRMGQLGDLNRRFFANYKYINLEKMIRVNTKGAFDTFYEEQVRDGEEGVCWISPRHKYQPGKRTWDWMKRVPMKSIEVTLLEVQPGSAGKKYEHSAGRILCEMRNGKKVKVGIFKGQTDEWRQLLWDSREDHIGSKLTIEFKDYSRYGIPVQPRFKSFRWDLG